MPITYTLNSYVLNKTEKHLMKQLISAEDLLIKTIEKGGYHSKNPVMLVVTEIDRPDAEDQGNGSNNSRKNFYIYVGYQQEFLYGQLNHLIDSGLSGMPQNKKRGWIIYNGTRHLDVKALEDMLNGGNRPNEPNCRMDEETLGKLYNTFLKIAKKCKLYGDVTKMSYKDDGRGCLVSTGSSTIRKITS